MNYQRNKNFELKEIGGELLLIPRGTSTIDYNHVTIFNETGALLYRAMEQPTDVDALAKLLVDTYSISLEEAKEDTAAYVQKMLEAGIIEGE